MYVKPTREKDILYAGPTRCVWDPLTASPAVPRIQSRFLFQSRFLYDTLAKLGENLPALLIICGHEGVRP